jgi:two-component sensor histidine kinase
VRRKLLAFINMKALAFAVVAPVIALGSVSGYIIANQKRLSVEQTVEQSVGATLNAAERELSKHLAAAEILASMAHLNHLGGFTEHIMDEIMTLRRGEWLNVIITDETNDIYNYVRQKHGEPLLASLKSDLTRTVMKTGHYDISPVMIGEQYSEPQIEIRVPIGKLGTENITHVLTVVVRAWVFSVASKSVLTPPHWRVGLLDLNGSIAGWSAASSPVDRYIGKVTPLVSMAPDLDLALTGTIDTVPLYVARSVSKLYPGWSATVGVPQKEVDRAIYGIVYTLGAAGISTIAITGLLCFVLVRTYARQHTTEALRNSLREKETLLREVHHRVKNNMQATMGILLFERSRISDHHAKERLRVISDRISVQGRVHQHLYERGNLHRIEIGTFLTELCQSIVATFYQDTGEIKLTVETTPLHCDIDVAMPLGLITNELMTNAVKHGLKGRGGGEITVGLKRHDDTVVLFVSNTGVGRLDSGECVTETTTQSDGIGTILIKELVRQIGGDFILMQDITGTTAKVAIPFDEFL